MNTKADMIFDFNVLRTRKDLIDLVTRRHVRCRPTRGNVSETVQKRRCIYRSLTYSDNGLSNIGNSDDLE